MYNFNQIQDQSYHQRLKLFIHYNILVPQLESVLKKLHDPGGWTNREYSQLAREFRNLMTDYINLEDRIQREFHMYDIRKAMKKFQRKQRGKDKEKSGELFDDSPLLPDNEI